MNEKLNIYEHFKTIPDPRIERGRKYLLEDIIFIAIDGADDWNDAKAIESVWEFEDRLVSEIFTTSEWDTIA